jgi:hypothetical protein
VLAREAEEGEAEAVVRAEEAGVEAEVVVALLPSLLPVTNTDKPAGSRSRVSGGVQSGDFIARAHALVLGRRLRIKRRVEQRRG